MLVQKHLEVREKPFLCTVIGCDMTFTNKNHLEWHSKKHEMMLNLGLVNKSNDAADETPTPTRFIRNCEEVGLFQDLQNVNPFDELFKKATDLAKSGVTLNVQANNSDDTLHTPHILPHITEKAQTTCLENSSDSDDTIIVDVVGNTDSRGRIREKSLNYKVGSIKVISFKDLLPKPKKKKPIENNSEPRDKIEKIREINRAAQLRCRKKKQQVWKEMEKEIVLLKEENKKLKLELQILKIQHSKCSGSTTNKDVPESQEPKKTSNVTSPTQLPLLIQVIPNTLSMLPAVTNNSSKVETSICSKKSSNTKKMTFRKIAPRLTECECKL